MDLFNPEYEVAKSWNIFSLASLSSLSIPPILFSNQTNLSDEEKEKIFEYKKENFMKFKKYVEDIDSSLINIKKYVEFVSKKLD